MSQPKKKFINCPQCDGADIEQTDYELEDGTEDADGRRCKACGWEGDVRELVCEEESGVHDDH